VEGDRGAGGQRAGWGSADRQVGALDRVDRQAGARGAGDAEAVDPDLVPAVARTDQVDRFVTGAGRRRRQDLVGRELAVVVGVVDDVEVDVLVEGRVDWRVSTIA
jgi:hypothetical protein